MPPAGALVCFPYAGGNAVNFEPMARALRGSGLAVYAVELPGHDLAAEREPFASIDQVVEQVVAEIARRGLTGVLLWGHSSGTAPAVATARALEERGVPVRRVFLGAQLLGDADRRRAAIAELSGLSDADIAARLAADGGYTALGELDAQRAEHVGAAYRHDCLSAHRYFARRARHPAAPKLAAPVTVVVAADDPSTADFARRHREWRLLADAGRPARARRRRPLLPAHPTGRGGSRPCCDSDRPATTCPHSVALPRGKPRMRSERTSTCRPPSPRPRSTCTRHPAGHRCCRSRPPVTRPRWAADAPGRAARHRARARRAPGPRARPA